MSLDLEAIKGRLRNAQADGNPWRDSWATKDIAALVAEVENLTVRPTIRTGCSCDCDGCRYGCLRG